jgi:UDP-glucose 4-epimerase
MGTRILITGSSGTLGKILIKSFTNKGIPVVGMDIKENNLITDNGIYRYYHGSITDREYLSELFRKEKPTHVFHLACSYNTIRNRQLEYENDVTGSENVLRKANDTSSVRQFVYFSSGAAYGGRRENRPWLTEDKPLKPGRYRYGLNKKIIEGKITDARLRPDLQKVILRICTVVGPSYDKDRSVVSLLIKFPYMLKICKNNMMQFLHEDDMVQLINKIIDDREIGGVYNIASDTAVKITDLVPSKKYINVPCWLLKVIFSILWNLRLLNLQPASVSYSMYPVVLDPSKLVKRYDYSFQYTTQEAFEETRKKNMLNPNEKY